MARLGTKRVSDVIDYEQDIQGAGLIRLFSGVGSGKNYWIRLLKEEILQFRMLLITSRRNTADAEAKAAKADQKIQLITLIDDCDMAWYREYEEQIHTHIVCTNSYIEYFFKKIYDLTDPRTHLWNMFDLIILDEAHSLTTDATFSDAPFYVEQFLRSVRKYNSDCDVLMMSGTQNPIDWLFEGEQALAQKMIDCYDTCVHLTPDQVLLMPSEFVLENLRRYHKRGERIIYFANKKKNMAAMIERMHDMGVPYDAMGISYSGDEADCDFPSELVARKEPLREYMVENQKIPSEIKLFFTTSKNKEGINILDDDIKIMFVESHQKTDLIQMAGRVRGNPNTGTGLDTLVIVSDAEQHNSSGSRLVKNLNRENVAIANRLFAQEKTNCQEEGTEFRREKHIADIEKMFRYIRYDYIDETFQYYRGKEEGERLQAQENAGFQTLIESIDETIGIRYVDGMPVSLTGLHVLKQGWFPDSEWQYILPSGKTLQERATGQLHMFLERKEYLDKIIDEEACNEIREYIYGLIKKYGKQELGFRSLPLSLGPMLKRFQLRVKDQSHHDRDHKIISKVG